MRMRVHTHTQKEITAEIIIQTRCRNEEKSLESGARAIIISRITRQ